MLVEWLTLGLVLKVSCNRNEAKLDILLKVALLYLFPLSGKVSHSALSEANLIRGEFAILAKSVQADHELHCLSLEGACTDLLPLAI